MELDRDTTDRLLIALFHLAGTALAAHCVMSGSEYGSFPFLRQVGLLMIIGHLSTLAGTSWYLDMLRFGSTVGWPLGLVLIGVSSLGGQDLRMGAVAFLAVNGVLYWLAGRLSATSVSLVPALAFDPEA